MPKQHYDTGVYWAISDDGAALRCKECKVLKSYTDVILTQIPKDDKRALICKECIDEDWLKDAIYLGMYKD